MVVHLGHQMAKMCVFKYSLCVLSITLQEDDDDDSNETSKSPTIDIDDDSLDSKDVKTGILSGDHSIQKKQDPERCCVCLMPQTDELALSKCDRYVIR